MSEFAPTPPDFNLVLMALGIVAGGVVALRSPKAWLVLAVLPLLIVGSGIGLNQWVLADRGAYTVEFLLWMSVPGLLLCYMGFWFVVGWWAGGIGALGLGRVIQARGAAGA